VFAAGLVVAHGTFNFIDAGVPVEVSGVRVQPGDLIHGDASGVTTIPPQIAEKVYGECLKVREREAVLRDYAHSREFSFEGLKARLLAK
jgi:regulator of RNase E activity RraA